MASPNRRKPAGAVGGAGTLLLVVAVLCFIWPVLALLALAVAGAALLVHRKMHWMHAWSALHSRARARSGRTG